MTPPPPDTATRAEPPVWVTVDDFGVTPRANREIVALAERGVITAVSVMVHADACTDLLPELAALPVRVGLHATFTDGRALTPALGQLPRAWWSVAARTLDPRCVRRYRDELRAQADRLRSLAGRLDFVNAHEHVHLLPTLWPQFAELVHMHAIAAVRAPAWPPTWTASPETAMACVAAVARTRASLPPGTVTTEPLGVLRAGRLDAPRLRALLAQTRQHSPQARELCLHPATASGPTPEAALLASGAVDRLLEGLGLRRERVDAPTPR